VGPVDGGEVVVGLERLPLGWLRSSAAIAMGDIEMPRAGESLLRFRRNPRAPKKIRSVIAAQGFAVISLAA
jgi:hypothetical protein